MRRDHAAGGYLDSTKYARRSVWLLPSHPDLSIELGVMQFIGRFSHAVSTLP
jgi:hypothetical protein